MLSEHAILIVETDIHLGKFLKRQLALNKYSVDVTADGKNASVELSGNHYDLVILALNLSGMDGMDLLKKIRLTQPRLPILVLSARNRTEDIVRGLEEGADDYLTKPFSLTELSARILVLLRRNDVAAAAIRPIAGDLVIDTDRHQAFRGPRRIDLTRREFEILEYMMDNQGKVLSRKTLMEDVWRSPYDPATNIVDVYMKYLRDKIDLEGETRLIRTIRGVGYLLSDGCERLPCLGVDAGVKFACQAPATADSFCAA